MIAVVDDQDYRLRRLVMSMASAPRRRLTHALVNGAGEHVAYCGAEQADAMLAEAQRLVPEVQWTLETLVGSSPA